MIKGIDIGYQFTKDSAHKMFRSAYSCTNEGLSLTNLVMINGKKYYYGVGNTCTDANKIYDTTTMVCLLSDIALSGDGNYYIVSGLPIIQYREHMEEFRGALMDYGKSELVYNGRKINYRISDVDICPQGAGAIYSIQNSTDCILFDIGSYTINIAMFERDLGILKMTKSDTIFKGILHLYEKIIKVVNAEFDLSLDNKYAEDILLRGLTIRSKKMDTSFVKEILIDYLQPVITQFKVTYPYQIYPIILMGGGGLLLKDIFVNSFSDVRIIQDSQFANANGFYQYGIRKWGSK